MVSRYFLGNDRLGKTNKRINHLNGISKAHKIICQFFTCKTALKMCKYFIEIVKFFAKSINFRLRYSIGKPVTRPPHLLKVLMYK